MATVDCNEDAVSLASSCLAEAIVDIFAELLKQPHVEQDDDFFELGGDSLTAAALMLELEKIGIELPVSVLFDSPTPAGIAVVADNTGALPDHSLVVLKPGTADNAIFIAPGLGGSALEMVSFARKVATPHQIYGLQPRDTNGEEVPLASIKDAAQFYLPLIRNAQPRGPYILAGYSLGGVTALEIARLLQASGEQVARIIMLDTLTPLQHFPWTGKLRFWARRAIHHSGELKHLPLRQLPAYMAGRAKGFARDIARNEGDVGRSSTSVKADVSQPRKPVPLTATAFFEYRPRFYPGSVAFIQAEVIDQWVPYYPDILWRPLTREFALYRVKGDHWTMLSRYPDSIAEAFSRCLATSPRMEASAPMP